MGMPISRASACAPHSCFVREPLQVRIESTSPDAPRQIAPRLLRSRFPELLGQLSQPEATPMLREIRSSAIEARMLLQ